MMSLIQSGSDTRIYRISSENKLDGMYGAQPSRHKSLTSFDDDAESFPMYVQIASTYGYLKLHTKYSKPLKLKVPTKSKDQSKSVDHQHKDIGVVHQFPETAIFIAILVKKHVKQFVLPVGSYFVNLMKKKLWVQHHKCLCLLKIQTRHLFFSFHKIKLTKQHIFII